MASTQVIIELPADYPDLIKELQEWHNEPVDLVGFIMEGITSTVYSCVENIHMDDPEKARELIRQYHMEEKYGYLLKESEGDLPDEKFTTMVRTAFLEIIRSEEGKELLREIQEEVVKAKAEAEHHG